MSSDVLSEASLPIDATDIAKVLSSTGPIVKCVLLKAPPSGEIESMSSNGVLDDGDSQDQTPGGKTRVQTIGMNSNSRRKRVLLWKDYIEEIELDTTPSKRMVETTLGGPFTFLGQYEDEGIVLMIRADAPSPSEPPPPSLSDEEISEAKLSVLRKWCKEREISMNGMLEANDLREALRKWKLGQSLQNDKVSTNPHLLQPPLDQTQVLGDILILKVAETKEELDEEDNATDPDGKLIQNQTEENESEVGSQESLDEERPSIHVATNEEFFLDYTLDEYLQFASRTDIPQTCEKEEPEEVQDDEKEDEIDSHDDDEEEEEEEEEDDNEDPVYRVGEIEEIAEEDKVVMFNLVMNEVLRQYREEHGRGPNTQELLEIRANIADELDVQVAHIDADQADWNKNAKDGTPAKDRDKKIGFSTVDKVLEYEPDPNEHFVHDPEGALMNDVDSEDSDEDDNDEKDQPPKKRQRTIGTDEENDEDSKPAAVRKDDPK